jgi:S-DNA-T family DNA segregation ATPase FtsK/SpoIIIE
MILATQRPSTDIITGVIKANIPCRVGLRVFSNVDSRVIMDKGGCEMLNGYGDMLYIDGQSPTITRLQGGFISTREMENVIYQLVQDNQPDNQFTFELESASDDFRKRYKEYYG